MTPAELQKLSEQNERRSQWWRTDVQTSVIAGQREGWNAALEHVHRVRQQQFNPIARLMLDLSSSGRPDVAKAEGDMWGPGGREHFADPRTGDSMGGRLPHEREGMVYLGGPVCHWHTCTRACRAYRPGWYANAAAARIIATLPEGGPESYPQMIAKLRERSSSAKQVAA